MYVDVKKKKMLAEFLLQEYYLLQEKYFCCWLNKWQSNSPAVYYGIKSSW